MDSNNPLHFFIDLADRKHWPSSGAQSFRELINKKSDSEGATSSVEKPLFKADDLEVGIPAHGYWSRTCLSYNLSGKLESETSRAINAVDAALAGMNSSIAVLNKLTDLLESMNAVIDKLSSYQETAQYPSILDSCKTVKREIQQRLKQAESKGPFSNSQQSTPKLQWLGQVNVLGTLFYHLLKGQDGGAPYISGTSEQVKRMLMENFVDNEGHELSKGTLDTIFTPSRSEKRANEGDRIELPNKKAKK